MQNKNFNLALASLALLGGSQLSAEEATEHTTLGSGQEIRQEIADQVDDAVICDKNTEHKCGEGSCNDEYQKKKDAEEKEQQAQKKKQAPTQNNNVKRKPNY